MLGTSELLFTPKREHFWHLAQGSGSAFSGATAGASPGPEFGRRVKAWNSLFLGRGGRMPGLWVYGFPGEEKTFSPGKSRDGNFNPIFCLRGHTLGWPMGHRRAQAWPGGEYTLGLWASYEYRGDIRGGAEGSITRAPLAILSPGKFIPGGANVEDHQKTIIRKHEGCREHFSGSAGKHQRKTERKILRGV